MTNEETEARSMDYLAGVNPGLSGSEAHRTTERPVLRSMGKTTSRELSVLVGVWRG